MKNKVTLTENELHNLIKIIVNDEILKESFSSNKIAQFVKQHGGLDKNSNNKAFSLSDLSDDDVLKTYSPNEINQMNKDYNDYNKNVAKIRMNDGSYIVTNSGYINGGYTNNGSGIEKNVSNSYYSRHPEKTYGTTDSKKN